MKTFLLLGYDYSEALLALPDQDSVSVGIRDADLRHIPPERMADLAAAFADRLIIADSDALLAEAAGAHAVITLGWRTIIPPEKRASPERWVNVHPALLPKYRGYHPVPHVIMNGEQQHGITAHYIIDDVDAGPIILQEAFEVSPFMTLRSLQHRARELMPSFLERLIELLRAGQELKGEPNPMGDDVIVAPRRTPADSRVDPAMTVAELYACFRASDPERFPTYVDLFGEKVFVTFFRAEDALRETPYDV